jgi:amino acid transporter
MILPFPRCLQRGFFMVKRLIEAVLGKPKNPMDPRIFHNISLIAFFAWVGLGADGLSSSCYGPEEAFHALGQYTHLALPLALAVAGTVFLLSATYSQIIEMFPSGGGGYLVASKLIGPRAGLASGCALLVDYVLTVAISVASSMDAIFSFLPPHWLAYKLAAVVFCLVILTALNLRGIKESILIMTPVFVVFLVTHAVVILYGIFSHGDKLPTLVTDTFQETTQGVAAVGPWALLFIFLKAFSLGGGTFTGIEAVSNGLQALREPRVVTGKRTMRYMAASLAFTAGGILINYILNGVESVPGQTLNATLVHKLTDAWPGGHVFFLATLLSEGALLLVAAQAGFLDGPRVMSNMAIDNWLPRRFTNLSDRLVIKDGILVMALAALAALLYTGGSVKILVVMYSINVFITFSLSQFGMIRHWVIEKEDPQRRKKLTVMVLGFLVTTMILLVTASLKFMEGGWVTLVITGALIFFCRWVHNHYADTARALSHLDQILTSFPLPEGTIVPSKATQKPTAVLLVNGYNGMGIHSFLAIHRLFPGHFKNFVFLSVGVIDSDRFKGSDEIKNLEASVQASLDKYLTLANKMGLYAESDMIMETDVIDGLDSLCQKVGREWPKVVYFTGQLAFEGETFWTRFLHNRTSFALQRRLIFAGLQCVILPIRVRLNRQPLPK